MLTVPAPCLTSQEPAGFWGDSGEELIQLHAMLAEGGCGTPPPERVKQKGLFLLTANCGQMRAKSCCRTALGQ